MTKQQLESQTEKINRMRESFAASWALQKLAFPAATPKELAMLELAAWRGYKQNHP